MSICSICNNEVEFSQNKIDFFQLHQFPHSPLYCNECQEKRLSNLWEFSALNRTIICATCGHSTLLHFTPSENEPLLCKQCYNTAQSKKI